MNSLEERLEFIERLENLFWSWQGDSHDFSYMRDFLKIYMDDFKRDVEKTDFTTEEKAIMVEYTHKLLSVWIGLQEKKSNGLICDDDLEKISLRRLIESSFKFADSKAVQ